MVWEWVQVWSENESSDGSKKTTNCLEMKWPQYQLVSTHYFTEVELLRTHRGVSGRKSIPVIRMTPKRHWAPNATLHPAANLSQTRSAMKLTMRPTVIASWLRDTSLPLKLFGASSALYTGTIMLRMLKWRGEGSKEIGEEKELGEWKPREKGALLKMSQPPTHS